MKSSLFGHFVGGLGCLLAVTSCSCGECGCGENYDKAFAEDLAATGLIHRPLTLDYSKAYETFGLTKNVLEDEVLSDMENIDAWTHQGIGSMTLTSERSVSGSSSMRLSAPARIHPTVWIQGMPPVGDTYRGLGLGSSRAVLELGGVNWEKYNRISYNIYPDCPGARSIYLNFYVENDGEIKVPDEFGREGYHEINLKNREWNPCFLEISELPRDKVTRVIFEIETFGEELTMDGLLQFDIDDLHLQVVENPEVVSGWQPAQDRIIFSTSGYRPESQKVAIVNVDGNPAKFKLVRADNGKVVFKGDVKTAEYPIGIFSTADFSSFKKEGQYCIEVGDVRSAPFYIASNLWDNSVWRIINFMFTERCGYPVPGKHGTCHTDLHAEIDGHAIPFNGGWHDAADMSQNALQTAEVAYSMFEMASRAGEKGNAALKERLTEEALWGMDYVLRGRLGDGLRFGGFVATNIWTDGIIGTIDDAGRRQIRPINSPYHNFKFSAVEAYAALCIENDPMLKENLEKVAKEDFGFAMRDFKEEDVTVGRMGTAPIQYMATISWAASILYQLTGEKYYAEQAARFIKYVMACQRTEPIGDGICGYFYRDDHKVVSLNYSHQSYDDVPLQALDALCKTQPDHPDRALWENTISLYGKYLKSIKSYLAPYGMIPSGVYNLDEPSDEVGFKSMYGGYASRLDSYEAMLKNGFKLDEEGNYLRAFPVWYSFKGNNAVIMAQGKNAAICAKHMGDSELMDMAEQQLCWIVGRNPFGQSLVWGEGSNYIQLYVALPGEAVGQIPLGIQTRSLEDVPYWPQNNTAVYKEVFGVPAGKWLSLVAEF